MLHIHNGDSSALTAYQANIPGEHLGWREALVCGPAPGNLSHEEFLQVRAEHLSSTYGVDLQKCADELRFQHRKIAAFTEHEEIVLWFEHDLFCQVQLIYLLHWFAQRERGATKLSLVCIDEFPGVQSFHGLGQLNEEQLTELFPQRREISSEQLSLGTRAWKEYSSPDARGFLRLRFADTSALPFLKPALINHLQRFPFTRNGLGRIENVALELIAAGHKGFNKLFPAFIRREKDYGFGDVQLYLALKRLADAPVPALKHSNGGDWSNDSARMFLSSFELTEDGRAMLAGEKDFVVSNGIDLWLGGIHLHGKEAAWRWDEGVRDLLVSL